MMSDSLVNSQTFSIPIGVSAHRLAQQFSQHHRQPHKAKQVYLNALAVSAVEAYLSCMGFATDRTHSQSSDPVMQAALDVADLVVPNRGRLECRPVLTDADTVYIPPDVTVDRIGYVAVQLDAELRQATLLGFVARGYETVALAELRSLDALCDYLTIEAAPTIERTHLSQWLNQVVESGWRSLDSLMQPSAELAFGLRTDALASSAVRRAKLYDLGVQLGNQAIALLVTVAPYLERSNEAEPPQVEISVQVHPVGDATYLPEHLNLSLVSDTGELLQEVRSRHYDNYIQLKRFRGVPSECFDIRITQGDTQVKETFMI